MRQYLRILSSCFLLSAIPGLLYADNPPYPVSYDGTNAYFREKTIKLPATDHKSNPRIVRIDIMKAASRGEDFTDSKTADEETSESANKTQQPAFPVDDEENIIDFGGNNLLVTTQFAKVSATVQLQEEAADPEEEVDSASSKVSARKRLVKISKPTGEAQEKAVTIQVEGMTEPEKDLQDQLNSHFSTTFPAPTKPSSSHVVLRTETREFQPVVVPVLNTPPQVNHREMLEVMLGYLSDKDMLSLNIIMNGDGGEAKVEAIFPSIFYQGNTFVDLTQMLIAEDGDSFPPCAIIPGESGISAQNPNLMLPVLSEPAMLSLLQLTLAVCGKSFPQFSGDLTSFSPEITIAAVQPSKSANSLTIYCDITGRDWQYTFSSEGSNEGTVTHLQISQQKAEQSESSFAFKLKASNWVMR